MSLFGQLSVGLLFVFSGLTSLIYQILWVRTLSLGVGSTSDSLSMVLAIFFLGMAGGSYLAGRFSHKIERPLKMYGYLEGFVGIYGIFVIYPLVHFHKIISFLPSSDSLSWFGVLLKFLCVAVLLAPPTMAMGASLPLMVKWFISSQNNQGKFLSRLYGLNTLGAVFGAFLGGYLVIPQLGILFGNHATAFVNIAIFAIALAIDKKNNPLLSSETKNKNSAVLKLNSKEYLIIAACGITGFSSISAQVIWNKYLGIFLGTNIYGLGLLLSLFLLGIALGSLLLSVFFEYIKNQFKFFMLLIGLAAVMILVASFGLRMAPIVANTIAYYSGDKIPLIVIKSIIAAILLFLPTCLFGAILPLGITLIQKGFDNTARITGLVYAVNTFGSILGSSLTGLILIPNIGSGMTHQLCVLLLVLFCTLGYLFIHRTFRQSLISLVLLVGGIFLILNFGSIDYRNIIKSAYFQHVPKNLSLSNAIKYFSATYEEFLMIHEGKTAITSLSQDPQDGEDYKDYYRLKSNGLNESIFYMLDRSELPKYEALLGYLPYAFSRAPNSAFVVGFGGGYTVDFFSSLNIENVHVAELESGVISASQYVDKGNNPILRRKNVKLEIEDARYVLTAKKHGPFDIIVSQPSHSWLTGVANLFTEEFFEIVKSNLSADGVFSQWLNLYNMDQEVLKSILHTFFKVFPHGHVFTNSTDEELIMIGTLQPLKINFQKLEIMTKNKALQDRLAQIPFSNSFATLSNFLTSREAALDWTKGAVTNTDINAYAEIRQSLLFYADDSKVDRPQTYLSKMYNADFSKVIEGTDVDEEFIYQILLSSQHLSKFDKFYVLLKKYQESMNPLANKNLRIGQLCLIAERYACAVEFLEKDFRRKPNYENISGLISAYMQLHDYDKSLKFAKQFQQQLDSQGKCYLLRAAVYSQDVGLAKKTLSEIENRESYFKNACGTYLDKALGLAYLFVRRSKDSLDLAKKYLEAYYQSNESDPEVYSALLSVYLQTNDTENSKSFSAHYSDFIDAEKSRVCNLVEYFKTQGYEADAAALSQRCGGG